VANVGVIKREYWLNQIEVGLVFWKLVMVMKE